MALSSFQAWQISWCLPISLFPLVSLSFPSLPLSLSPLTSSFSSSFQFSLSILCAIEDSAVDLNVCSQAPHPFRKFFINRTHTDTEGAPLHKCRVKHRLDSLVNHYLPVGTFHCEWLFSFKSNLFFVTIYLGRRPAMFTRHWFIKELLEKREISNQLLKEKWSHIKLTSLLKAKC